MQKSAQAPHRGSAYLQDALIAGPCGDRPVGDTSIMSCSSGKASIGTGSVKSHLWTSLDLAFTPLRRNGADSPSDSFIARARLKSGFEHGLAMNEVGVQCEF